MGIRGLVQPGSRPRVAAVLAGAAALVAVAVVPSAARMTSTPLPGRLCETVGGAKIVPVPGFPGELIDRRLRPDLRLLERRYKIFVTDGYSTDPVHAPNGEHPLGLAVDIVPDFANGGGWNKIDELARWAEPKQDIPRAPFRWVGYDGDAGHGRGDHLHLSWSHSALRPERQFPRTVFTKRCPSSGTASGTPDGGGTTTGSPGGSPSGGVSATTKRRRHRHRRHRHHFQSTSGGVAVGRLSTGTGTGRVRLARPHTESGGVGVP